MNRRRAPVGIVVFASCVLAAGAQLFAHDLWIELSSFVTDPGKPLSVRLRVGVDLIGDPVARDSNLIDRFVMVAADGTKPVPGRDGLDPAGLVQAAPPGLVIVGYSSRPSPIVLSAEKFHEYLAEEGLESIAALRAKRNQASAEAREEFSRCAKALLSSGPVQSTQGDRALGFQIELVAERNPYTLTPGQDLPVRLLFRHQPLQGALVVAMNKKNPAAKVSARSRKDGRVHFRLDAPGMWLIKAVHMTPAAAGSSAEWTSFWASLTFQLAENRNSKPGY